MQDGQISGLILGLLTFSIVGVQLLFHKYWKKWTNSYYFWCIICSFLLVYFLGNRYILDAVDFSEGYAPGVPQPGVWTWHYYMSRVLLTDFCPFFYCFCCIALIAQPSRKIAGYAAPILIFACCITILAGIMFGDKLATGEYSASFSLKYIFVGAIPQARLKFWIHATGLIMGVGILQNTPNRGLKGFLWTNVAFLGFYCWVLFCAFGLGVKQSTSGASLYDWTYGDFKVMGNFMHMSYPAVVFPSLCVCYTIISLLIWTNYWAQHKTKWFFVSTMVNEHPLKGYYVMDPKVYSVASKKKTKDKSR